MQRFLDHYKAVAFASGIFTFISVLAYVNFLPGWVCFVPLFMVLQNRPPTACFKAGLMFGLAIALPSFYWMVAGAQRFTGTDGMYGYLVMIVSTIILSLYFGGINYCFSILRTKKSAKLSFAVDALLIACVYVTGEALLMLLSKYLPWFGFHSGNPLMDNIYSIQPAAVFGIHSMSFIVVFVNYLIAGFIVNKQWLRLSIPAGVIVIYMLCGYVMYRQIENNPGAGKPVKVAILNGNIPPEIKWDDSNGKQLVDNLLELDRKATALKPDIALWNESAVPWTYRPDDDLVNEILKISAPAHITHMLGINTDYQENEVYNSVYELLPDGKVAGRYDKRILLAFIEQPFAGLIFPFLSSQGFIVKTGENNNPLNTPYGKAGIMVCNESSVPSAASGMVSNGAQYLFNLSNDGWFSNTYIADLHFYNVRMRAVETRKDIACNSNYGFSGLVKASGEIMMKERSDEPFVKMVTVQPNNDTTLAASSPLIFLYCCVFYILFLAAIKVVQKFKRT
ncbi:MAG TPA: apolipoprotein N-acyltransferase [Panacibacter sp.]|nr:apolipoprotein N-acyltransferase [Panacibacter sp.]